MILAGLDEAVIIQEVIDAANKSVELYYSEK